MLQALLRHYIKRGKKSNKEERVKLVCETGVEWRVIYKWLYDREKKEGKEASKRGRPMQKIGKEVARRTKAVPVPESVRKMRKSKGDSEVRTWQCPLCEKSYYQ